MTSSAPPRDRRPWLLVRRSDGHGLDGATRRTWPVVGSIIAGLLVVIMAFGRKPAAAVPRPGQIILIRHGEKPMDRSNAHLAPAGVQRAEALVSFITTDVTVLRFGSPVAIFAAMVTKNNRGYRTEETVDPLAHALHLPVQMPLRGKDAVALAQLVLANPAYAGKTVLICWNHEEITKLAAALGVSPEPPAWPDSLYDQVYVIAYHDGKADLTITHYPSS